MKNYNAKQAQKANEVLGGYAKLDGAIVTTSKIESYSESVEFSVRLPFVGTYIAVIGARGGLIRRLFIDAQGNMSKSF